MAQAQGKTAAWIDVEQSFDDAWATKLGVDTENLIVSEAKTTNDMANIGTDLMTAGVDVLVVDSISALLPAIYFEKGSEELKDLENTKQIGAESKDIGNAVKMLNFANKNTLLILISQQRNQISAMYTQLQPTGGQAAKFYSSVVIKLFSSESQKQAIEKKVQVGDKLINQIVGRKILWDVQFSKTSPPFQQGEYDFYFRGPDLGIDSMADLADTCVELGIIEKGGAWYTCEGERYQGRDKLVLGIKEDLDMQEALIEKVRNV
jgi:recombination protein RecA